MHFLDHYIGVPYKTHGRDFNGCDCWGLFRLYYLNQFGIELPLYLDYSDAAEREETSSLIQTGVGQAWTSVEMEVPGDGVLIRMVGYLSHVGVLTSHGIMLHTMRGRDSHLQRLDNPSWKPRVQGFYRHASRFSSPARI